MASLAVVNAVETLLAANWNTITGASIPVFLPNTASLVPNDGSAFLVLEFPLAREFQNGLGPPGVRTFREEGAFVFTLCIPIGVGVNPSSTPYAQWMEGLRGVFRGIDALPLRTWSVDPPHFEEDSDRGAYSEMSIAVAYFADFEL